MNQKSNMNCDCGGLLHETTSLSSTEKRAYCHSCNTQYFASNSDMLEGDTEWLPVVEQPKEYADKQKTTPIVEVHYEYCHGIYVVLALLIGGLIGFIFGVGR